MFIANVKNPLIETIESLTFLTLLSQCPLRFVNQWMLCLIMTFSNSLFITFIFCYLKVIFRNKTKNVLFDIVNDK